MLQHRRMDLTTLIFVAILKLEILKVGVCVCVLEHACLHGCMVAGVLHFSI